MTVRCVAVSAYRSLHQLRFTPGPLTVITGGNGVGKSNVYRALELIHAAAHGRLAITLAREGGLASAAWAGPEHVRTPGARRRGTPIQGTVRQKPLRVQLGIQVDAGAFEMTLGHPTPGAGAFSLDPEVKEEWLWPAPPRSPQRTWLTRDHAAARCQDSDGRWRSYTGLDPGESILAQLDEPTLLPELHTLRQTLRGFRFYHGFRTDPDSPLRVPRIGVRTPVLASSGEDLAAALCTVREIGDGRALREAVRLALGADLELAIDGNHFEVGLRVPGLLRRLGARELSDGSLKYLALLAALYSPRPAPLVVFNEPEASLHPELLEPLAISLALSARHSSVWVITHARALVAAIEAHAPVTRIELARDDDGATIVEGQQTLDRPRWP